MTRTRSEAESSVANPLVKRPRRTARRHCLNPDLLDLKDWHDSVISKNIFVFSD
jgi:hypothetical protein